MQTVLTIAGYDPSSGAGATADLMVFAAHGLFGTSCITGLTVQSTTGVLACYPVGAAVIAETLACLDDDLPPSGIKIGMLGTTAAVAAVCEYVEGLRKRGSEVPVVVDPVMRSSSGRELLEPMGIELLFKRLLPLADWVTPNRAELDCLVALSETTSAFVFAQEEISQACEMLQKRLIEAGGRRINVLATLGGTIPPDDLLRTADGQETWLRGEHVETSSTHGTGCALSSALVCRLMLGDEPVLAARNAKSYVAQALRNATPIGHGHGPMNHLWKLR